MEYWEKLFDILQVLNPKVNINIILKYNKRNLK